MNYDLDTMNETDVREILVRPLLERLGYRHGTEANIRTEVRLRYDRAFLGRKNPRRDPELVGRADYLCEVIPYGRWVVEVKGPQQALDEDSIQQAHTYAAHPEIAANFFMITNGREWRLYRTSQLGAPLMKWNTDQTEDRLLQVFNLVGVEAIKSQANLIRPDPHKPLGPNLASKLAIVGGSVTYEEHVSTHPMMKVSGLPGLSLPVTDGFVERTEDGRLHAHVKVASSMPMMKELSDALGVDGYDFYSVDEYVSVDPDKPSIFQNFIEFASPIGTPITVPGLGTYPTPFESRYAAFTEAVGFVSDGRFQGVMRLSYEFAFTGIPPMVRQFLVGHYGSFPSTGTMDGVGQFNLGFRSAI